MKFDILRRYSVYFYPYEDEFDTDECIRCCLSIDCIAGANSVSFTAETEHYDTVCGLVCVNSYGIWFLDQSTRYGFCMSDPLYCLSIYDELQKCDEYDDVQCMLIAKCIELICKDHFNLPVFQKPVHIHRNSNRDNDELPF